MNIKEVKELINEILQSDISEFELEHTGTKLKLRRGFAPEHNAAAPAPVYVSHAPSAPTPAQKTVAATSASAAAAGEEDDEVGLHIITSPIVGTFYRSPSPGTDPFIKIGDTVEEGNVLCIVEAMKLMNEIPSDMAGEIARIFVENAHPVEYGQKLFAIRPRK
jgi:acetyl-CoA carboxylase biotin carboxyl carrier protein